MHWLPLTPANKVNTAEFCNRRGQRGSLRRNIRQAPKIEKWTKKLNHIMKLK